MYDNFEDFDYSDGVHGTSSPEMTNRKTVSVNKESNNDCKVLFMLQRARHCWYSREELKKIKNERKEIVRALRKVNFNVSVIDTSIYELRGLEAYLSPETLRTTLRKRKEALISVFNEQNRQRQSEHAKPNIESLQFVSLRASEWFRTRATEMAEKDAKEAHELYLNHPEVMRMMEYAKGRGRNTATMTKVFQNQQGAAADQDISMVYEKLNESIGLMDIDDDTGIGGLSDPTLSFWANSSWTKDLMDE